MPTLSAGDRRLRYREAGRGGRAIVLIHGAGTSSLLWLRLLPALSRWGRVLALDLPGHGRSEGPGLARVELYREVVRTFCAALELERPVLAGHSMGGAVALDYALAYPGELSALGLCATAASFEIAPEVLRLSGEGGPAFGRFFAGAAFGSRVSALRAETATRDLLTARADVLAGDFGACAAFDLGSRLAEVRIPATVVVGAQDRILPPVAAEALGRAIPGAQIERVPGCGHMVPWEAPEALATALAWLVASAR